jgi:RNase P subunit RPR2
MCNFATHLKSSLAKHMMTVPAKIKKHKCPCCDYMTNYMTALIKHRKAMHEGRPSLKCSHCDFTVDIGKKHALAPHVKPVYKKITDHVACRMSHVLLL